MLLNGWLLEVVFQRLDIGGDAQRLDAGELVDTVALAPGEGPVDRMQVGHAGVFVANGGGEEFRQAASGALAGVGDQRRNRDRGGRGDGAGGPDDGQLSGLLLWTDENAFLARPR